MFNHKLPSDFPMQTLRKKTSPCKYKNEPGRFLGEGVSFRAKLIGVLEVPEARGDRMCQEALADLKMAIRAAGEHKQRIQVHVAIDGLRLRDDKTSDSLYHHPVHKISFIAQDMTDSRAFGYIFGSPDTGHRFFGIKTDKAASQVVIAMRDLFQVVFELKKKEVELAKQQLEGKAPLTVMARHNAIITDIKAKQSLASVGEVTPSSLKNPEAAGGVGDLLDLEQELSSLQRGLTQVEGLTPSSDPFGDSFVLPQTQKGLLPPPPGLCARGRSTSTTRVFSPSKSTPFELTEKEFDASTPAHSANAPVDNFNDPVVSQPAPSTSALSYDVFTELDPLGTGRSKPYVDKKLFFQELKNPPKRVLKDLVPPTQGPSLLTDIEEPKAGEYGPATSMASLSRHSGGSVAVARPPAAAFFSADPFAETDPFDNSDPFSDSFRDDPFTGMQELPKQPALRAEARRPARERRQENGVAVGVGGGSAGSAGGLADSAFGSAASTLSPASSACGVAVSAPVGSFNGPLQVSLPPEPAPKSPRLHRQGTDLRKVRARPVPRGSDSDRISAGGSGASPPPPLPPKKVGENIARPPPRPPHEPDDGPPLPRPARKKEPMADRSTKPRLSSAATNSSSEEYLSPLPPPLPAARRLDITLAQLLDADMGDLAARLRVPEATLSSMTLPQLTDYLRSYLAADNDRAHIHIEPSAKRPEKERPATSLSLTTATSIEKPPSTHTAEFKPQFEDNFAPTENSDGFVANFDDFDKKANPSYDRYAAFREIQEQELKSKSILDPIDLETSKDEPRQDSDEKEELTAINDIMLANRDMDIDAKEMSRSPLKSLDELTLDSFNMFRNSVSPKPTQIDAKIEDIKSVMLNLQIDNKSRRSVSPRETSNGDIKRNDNNKDRYAALREITITEPSDEFESLPPEVPKERKRSDEKSDGFDNSDFFDCIDNSSLSFSHVEDAFRKSPVVKEREEEKKVEEKKEPVVEPPRAAARLSAGSISDVPSGSSPDIKAKSPVPSGDRRSPGGRRGRGGRWAALGGASPWSSDSRDSDPRPRRRRVPVHNVREVSSSSSRDVSPWDEEPPPRPRPAPTLRDRDRDRDRERERDSRHNSSGSRECLDSGSGREKDKRDLRERDISRDGRDSARDCRDSGSGRDRRDVSKERDHREHSSRRSRRSQSRECEPWERDRFAPRHRDRDRDRSDRDRSDRDRSDRDRSDRRSHLRYRDEDDYSDGGSGKSSPRERWPDPRWRRDERNYGSLGWRESRRRNEVRQTEEPLERRYNTTIAWPSRRSGSRRDSDRDRDTVRDPRDPRDPREGRDPRDPRDARDPRDSRDSRDPREARDPRDPRRRSKRDDRRARDYRFSSDFSPRERDREPASPFDNDFAEPPPPPMPKKRAPYSTLEGTRFSFEPEEAASASAASGSARFRFDSDSVSPRSMFEDDFTNPTTPALHTPHTPHTPRPRTASIAEEDEDVPPLRAKPAPRDIKKSESINIFARDTTDPFEGDSFFACTGSDRAARRDNWPGDFAGFDT